MVVEIRLLPPCQVPAGRLKGLADEARTSVGLPDKVIVVELGKNVGSLLAQLWAAAESAARGLLLCIQGRADQPGLTQLGGSVLLVVAGPECVVVQLVERVSRAGKVSVDDCPAAEADVGVGTGGQQVSGKGGETSVGGPGQEVRVGSDERLVDEDGREGVVDAVDGTQGGGIVDVEVLNNELKYLLGKHLPRRRHDGR